MDSFDDSKLSVWEFSVVTEERPSKRSIERDADRRKRDVYTTMTHLIRIIWFVIIHCDDRGRMNTLVQGRQA